MSEQEEFFVTGARYRNRKGTYEVLDIGSDGMRIRYDSGEEQTIQDLKMQKRIVKNTRYDSVRLLPYGDGDERNKRFVRSIALLAKRGAFEAIVPPKSQVGFERDYRDLKGVDPVPGRDMYYLHQDPNVDKWGVELRITFEASEEELQEFDFGPDVSWVPDTQEGQYRINCNSLIWKLWEMGFCLGKDQDPGAIKDHIPMEYVETFEEAVATV